MLNFKPSRFIFSRPARSLATAASLLLTATGVASAQGGGGAQGGSSSPPAASTTIKKAATREDPLTFLLDRKKLLLIDKPVEDSLKKFRKEMQRLQDVVYKDLDKAAARKEQGQLPSPVSIMSMTTDGEARVKDIQSAYRDRARLLLTERQKIQVDSLDAIWKRPVPADESRQRRPAILPR